jgi:quercetin dioxygenase-like cupin family protein
MLKRIKQDPAAGTASADPIFIQGSVEIQNLVTEGEAKLLRVTSVTFHNGARNQPHRHTCDQVLIATHGRGFIATHDEEFALEPGDVVATGTPPGVGFARKPPVYLKDGDVVEVEIEGLGVLSNPVRQFAAASARPN